jgi:hypothetical protein
VVRVDGEAARARVEGGGPVLGVVGGRCREGGEAALGLGQPDVGPTAALDALRERIKRERRW